jgi:GTPase
MRQRVRANAPPGYRSGFVSIVGRPNVGKSTLLNALLNRKVAITSAKPQTTRNAIRGVLSGEGWQMVFIDTPGLHKPKTALGTRLNEVVRRTLKEVDAVVFMTDATQPVGTGDRYVAEEILQLETPAICVVNKMDAVRQGRLVEELSSVEQMGEWREIIPISAREGRKVEELRDLLVGLLPEGPQYYPDDQFMDQPREFLVAEIVREKALELTRQEIPHSIAVLLEELIDREDGITEIQAVLYVERDSQKGIVIGKGGAVLKAVGTAVREQLPEGAYLELFVRVDKDWQRRPKALERLGY